LSGVQYIVHCTTLLFSKKTLLHDYLFYILLGPRYKKKIDPPELPSLTRPTLLSIRQCQNTVSRVCLHASFSEGVSDGLFSTHVGWAAISYVSPPPPCVHSFVALHAIWKPRGLLKPRAIINSWSALERVFKSTMSSRWFSYNPG
jgi:hypothetical protein